MRWRDLFRILLWPRLDGPSFEPVVGTIEGPLPRYFQCTRIDMGQSWVVKKECCDYLVTRFWYEVETAKDYYSWHEDHEHPIFPGHENQAALFKCELFELLLKQRTWMDDMYNFGRVRVIGYDNDGFEYLALSKYPNGCWVASEERPFYSQFHGKNGAFKDSIKEHEDKGRLLWRAPSFGGGLFCSHKTGWHPGYLT